MSYAGIDYGLGKVNIDNETGIRYGVISIHEVTQAWGDSSEPQYSDPQCPECQGKVIAYNNQKYAEKYKQNMRGNWDYVCRNCKIILDNEEVFPENPDCFTYEKDGYACQQGGDDSDIFILKSPFFTYCQFCSPCAPGAGYITNSVDEIDGGIKSYCFGHDWFEDGKAPYPIFSVKTGKLVNP